jgi:hypothetical protein
VLAQLRGVFAAVQSTEVAQEHQDDGTFVPEGADSPGRTRRVDKVEVV